jgi:hypothetical protein
MNLKTQKTQIRFHFAIFFFFELNISFLYLVSAYILRRIFRLAEILLACQEGFLCVESVVAQSATKNSKYKRLLLYTPYFIRRDLEQKRRPEQQKSNFCDLSFQKDC